MIENENLQKSVENKQNKEKEEKEEPNKIKEQKNEHSPLKEKRNNIPVFDDPSDNLLYNINNYALLVNKFDFYGNSIPLGAFCYAISFIMYGFFEANVFEKEDKDKEDQDKYIYIIILLFGGLGQIIAGLFEYIKGRTFPSNLYILFGIYFVSLFLVQYPNNDHKNCRTFFYGSWAVLTFPLFLGSTFVNVFYLVQTFIAFAFFVLRCIGERYEKEKINEVTSGVFEIVTGIFSLYICFNQIINEAVQFQMLPSFPLQNDNEIDIYANSKR